MPSSSPATQSSEASSEPTKGSSTTKYTPSSKSEEKDTGILPMVLFSVCLAASAGFTMYTKRSSTMLRSMELVTERQALRNPPRIGPPTKSEWEKLKPRWDDDDTI